jgi:hypothetical protein
MLVGVRRQLRIFPTVDTLSRSYGGNNALSRNMDNILKGKVRERLLEAMKKATYQDIMLVGDIPQQVVIELFCVLTW